MRIVHDMTAPARPLRILHVILSLGVGGAEKLAYDMITRLPAVGCQGSAVCLQMRGALADRLQAAGVPVHFRPRRPGLDLGLIAWLRRIIERERIDVVHAHQYTPLVYAVLASLGQSRVRVVYTEHGRILPERRRWKRRLINPLLARRVDHLVSISHSTREAMARYDYFPAERIEVIHNGVDLAQLGKPIDPAAKRRELGLPEAGRIIGAAARLEEVKNLPLLLRVFRRVLDQRPETLLLIAGIGSLEATLKAEAARLGLGEQVRFLGLRFDLPELYQLMEVFLLTSFTEGISITLLEAMASRVPAVATDVGGNGEVVVEGETGYLLPLEDEAGLAARVDGLLADPESARGMGMQGRARVEREFCFTGMLEAYLGRYRGDLWEMPNAI